MIVSFTARPSWVTTGQSTTLSWSVSEAKNPGIRGIGAVSGGSVSIKPVADTDYLLTAINQFGATQMHASVAVYAPPTYWFAPRPNSFHIDLSALGKSAAKTTLLSSAGLLMRDLQKDSVN